jgi:hypothetical protein
MQTYQRYAMKFVGISLVGVLVIGGPFWWLAAVSTGTLPAFFTFLGGVVSVVVVSLVLFWLVSQMTEQQQGEMHTPTD